MATGIIEVFAKAGYDVTYVGRSAAKVDAVKVAIAKSWRRRSSGASSRTTTATRSPGV